jgi:integrase
MWRRDSGEDEGLAPDVVDGLLEEAELPFIRPRHRPESDTPLKNGHAGERVINIADSTADILRDYIRVNRPDVVDEHGRRPLLASKRGTNRLSTSGLRNTVYILTQPCEFGDPCPYGEDPETCVAREHGKGSKCPGARSPHKIRTGSITWHRDRGWPIPELADRANTSEDLIRGVYDQPEQLIRGAVRREHLHRLDEHEHE